MPPVDQQLGVVFFCLLCIALGAIAHNSKFIRDYTADFPFVVFAAVGILGIMGLSLAWAMVGCMRLAVYVMALL